MSTPTLEQPATPEAGRSLLKVAEELDAYGICAIRVAEDGTKRPLGEWKVFQIRRPTDAERHAMFGDGRATGLGFVTGQCSGGLEMTELEGRAVRAGAVDAITELAKESGDLELWLRLTAGGYVVGSPSGGWHMHAVLTDAPVPGNTKLAATAEHVTLAETRGEGGFVVTAPSHGRVHPTGGEWTVVFGSPAAIPRITADERDRFHGLIRAALDRRPAPEAAVQPTPFLQPGRARADGGVSPGDDFNAKASWADVLEPLGWRPVFARGDVLYWRRPGKSEGISASTGYGAGDWLYVWTSSTVLEPERTYTKFGAVAALRHGRDHTAAAKALKAEGFGKEPERPVVTTLPAPSASAALAVEGALATVHAMPAAASAEETTMVLSEDGHAQALVAEYSDRIRFCPDWGRWLVWDGTVWRRQPEGGGLVREFAKTIARAIPDVDQTSRSFKRKALSAIGTTGALRMAQTDPAVVVPFKDLDADPWLLNTPGGVIELRSGQLRPARPEDLLSRVTACTPDPAADRSRWTEFLGDTFGGDAELIGFLQRLMGLCAVGEVLEHILPFAIGSGRNGKGVFFETQIAVLGEDYATTAPSGFLTVKGERHLTEIARMAGRRLVVASETNQGDRFDEEKVKRLTGGDSLAANFMRQDHFTFTPSHTICLMANHRPDVKAGGPAFWSRLLIISFNNVVPPEKQIKGLDKILAREHGPAVLAWIVEGAAEYARVGLQEPASVRTATEEYEADQDTVARFLAERCHIGGGQQVQVLVAEVWAAYTTWCREEGETPVSSVKALTQALRQHGVESAKGSKGVRRYSNVTVLVAEGSPTQVFYQPAPPMLGGLS